MTDAFAEAMVDRSYYAHAIPAMPNDEKDRHVLAASIASRADVLVTANLKNFRVPAGFCYTEAQHLGDFLRYTARRLLLTIRQRYRKAETSRLIRTLTWLESPAAGVPRFPQWLF